MLTDHGERLALCGLESDGDPARVKQLAAIERWITEEAATFGDLLRVGLDRGPQGLRWVLTFGVEPENVVVPGDGPPPLPAGFEVQAANLVVEIGENEPEETGDEHGEDE